MTRDELRVAVLDALKKTKNIAVQAATGIGKSKIALDAINEVKAKSILFVVAEVAHIRNWKDEFNKWDFDPFSSTIICYASLKKYRNTSWDVVVFDEAHHLGSELRLEIFDTISAKYRIFLSATLKESLIYKLEASCGPIKSIKAGLQDAFDNNILPEPKIYLIPLVLDSKNYDQEIVEEWGKAYARKVIECSYRERWTYLRNKSRYPNVTLKIKCTQQQKYDYLTEQFNYYKNRYMNTRNEIIKNKWLQFGSKRKTYLGSIKLPVAYNLIKQLESEKERFICFCTNIEQATWLGGDNAVHSKRKDNASIIQKFNDKEINSLYAVGMLQEGVNLNDIDAGVIIQLDGEERSFIQRFGRTLRADSPEQYIIYYRATRDEEYLKNALENIDKKYIKEL